MSAAAERAAIIWNDARFAAEALSSMVKRGSHNGPYIHLGTAIPEEIVRELAKASGGELREYRALDEGSVMLVWVSFEAKVRGVSVTGFGTRIATDADEAIPLRGRRA